MALLDLEEKPEYVLIDAEKNVDVQAQYNSIFYNIEIKSPEYEEHKAGHLCGIIANRTEGKELINLAEHIRSILQNQYRLRETGWGCLRCAAT